MNPALYIMTFFFIASFILLCLQLYWVFQILIYKIFSKKHIYLAFFLLVFNLLILSIVLKPLSFIQFHTDIIHRSFEGITVILCGMLIPFLYIICVYFLVMDNIKINNVISNESIHEALNNMSAGLCFYDETGFPLLMNNLMESISQSICNTSLSNGYEFWDEIETSKTIHGIRISATYPTILLDNGKVYSFSNQVLILGKEKIHQLIASDVTDLYSMSKKIEEDNQILTSIHKRLQEYNSQVNELTRDEEILHSKIQIHDNLGHSIIATKYYLMNGESSFSKKELLNGWRTNISLLNKENTKEPEDLFSILNDAAEAIGLKLVFNGDITNWNQIYKKIFMIAVKECMTNAVQHAHATQLNIQIENNEKNHVITLRNNGNQPSIIIEGGGLTSLRHQVEKAFGTMKEKIDDAFSLVIELPNEER